MKITLILFSLFFSAQAFANNHSVEFNYDSKESLEMEFDNSQMVERDNTIVIDGIQNYALFKYGLKLLVRWSGGQITNRIGNLIDRKASQYSYLYQNVALPYVNKAYTHLDGLIDNTFRGKEPAGHNVNTCPICRGLLYELFNY